MKILYLYAEVMGYTFATINALIKIGCEVHVVCWDKKITQIQYHGKTHATLYGRSQFNRAKLWNLVKDVQPDLVVVLGDRFEIFPAVSTAIIAKIPVAHLHGGETTEGAFDEYIRHSITKMSHLHFVATNEYRNRVIQMGEQPDSVFNVGGLGIDNINKLSLLAKDDFEKAIDSELGEKNLLVTFHPVTLENHTSQIQFQELLSSVSELKKTKIKKFTKVKLVFMIVCFVSL